MKYYLIDINPGKYEGRDDRRDWVYASLVDEDGHLVISATLEYILAATKERNYQVTNLLDAFIEVEKLYSVHRKLFDNG